MYRERERERERERKRERERDEKKRVKNNDILKNLVCNLFQTFSFYGKISFKKKDD